MCGNGWLGSATNGVISASMRAQKRSARRVRSASSRSPQRTTRRSSRARSGSSDVVSTRYARRAIWRARMRITSSCSAGVSPSGVRRVMPAATCSLDSATRVMKKSSWREPKMARNRTRSSSGM